MTQAYDSARFLLILNLTKSVSVRERISGLVSIIVFPLFIHLILRCLLCVSEIQNMLKKKTTDSQGTVSVFWGVFLDLHDLSLSHISCLFYSFDWSVCCCVSLWAGVFILSYLCYPVWLVALVVD